MKNILIIGAGSAGSMIASEITRHSKISDKYKIIGFLDDDKNKKNVLGIPVLSSITNAKTIIDENNITEVIIAIPSANRSTINNIIQVLAETQVKIKIVPGLYEIIEGDVSLNHIRDITPDDLLGREEVGFDLEKLKPFYKNKTIIITGAGGSIGSEILMQILKLPIKKVIGFGHGENSIHNLIHCIENENRFDYIIGDIKDKNKLNFVLKQIKPDMFFHAAAHKHVSLMEKHPDEAVKNNIIGTYNSARASINAGVRRFILISTDKAVNPTSVMGATKRIAERIILSLDKLQDITNFSLTRFGNVINSRGSVIPIFKKQIEKGGPITITHPDIERFFMSIPEAARLVIKSAAIEEGKIFILDMGKPVKILELAKNLIKLYGRTEDEIPIVFTGIGPGEKMYEEVLTRSENTVKTAYNKLLVSKEEQFLMNEKELLSMINEFEEITNTYDNNKVKLLLKKYVPEFKG